MAEAEDAKSGSDTEEEDEGEGGLLANADDLNKGGFFSESVMKFFQISKKNIPKNYPELEI